MYFLILIVGLALWVGAHFFKRVAPERRAAMGDSGKGAVALAIVAGFLPFEIPSFVQQLVEQFAGVGFELGFLAVALAYYWERYRASVAGDASG